MLSVLGVYVYAKLIFVLHSQSIPNLSHSLAEFITDHAFRACFDRHVVRQSGDSFTMRKTRH